jgi:hypothetical protein
MYTPYVDLDAHSQARFAAVGGLTSSATMPAVPALQPASLAGPARRDFAGVLAVKYRDGAFTIRGGGPGATGTLAVWTVRGEEVARLVVADGSARGPVLKPGAYLYRVTLRDGTAASGKLPVSE